MDVIGVHRLLDPKTLPALGYALARRRGVVISAM